MKGFWLMFTILLNVHILRKKLVELNQMVLVIVQNSLSFFWVQSTIRHYLNMLLDFSYSASTIPMSQISAPFLFFQKHEHFLVFRFCVSLLKIFLVPSIFLSGQLSLEVWRNKDEYIQNS